MSQQPPVKLEDGYQDFPLRCCSKEDMMDTRYHILKLQTKASVDINGKFTQPVRLHRKDPKNIQFQLTRSEIDSRKRAKEEEEAARERAIQEAVENGEDIEMLAEIDPQNKYKYKKGEADLTQVAPDGGARKPKKNLFKKKTRQINLMDDEKRKLRYEEYYPWVLEDYDGSNIWVGNYEAGNSDSYVMFLFDKDGFKMVPAEKMYKFTQRNRYATLTLEEAEAKMEKNSSVPRWLMKRMENQSEEGATPDHRFRNSTKKFRTVIGGAKSTNDRDSDHDDIDYDEEFADDEEAPIMDGDEEENKLSERRMKREMLKAQGFTETNAEGDDEDDFDDLFDTRKVDKEGKKLKKVLNKTEGNMYDSDDDDLNPYLSRSDLEDDDEDEDLLPVKEEGETQIPPANGHGKKRSTSPRRRTVSVVSVKDCMVVIRASPQFLSSFPAGDWNPNVRKRTVEQTGSPTKKIKMERSSSPTPFSDGAAIKLESSDSVDITRSKSASPPVVSDGSTLVTAEEVISLVNTSPLTTKELLQKLRGRVTAHPDNKARIIELVKKHLKLEDGKLVVKN